MSCCSGDDGGTGCTCKQTQKDWDFFCQNNKLPERLEYSDPLEIAKWAFIAGWQERHEKENLTTEFDQKSGRVVLVEKN